MAIRKEGEVIPEVSLDTIKETTRNMSDNEFKESLINTVFHETMHIENHYFNQYVINSIAYAIYVNLFSWIMQFIGHFIFEGNRPALLDSIAQSFLMAPLFSYYEFMDICKSKNN